MLTLLVTACKRKDPDQKGRDGGTEASTSPTDTD